MNLNIANVTFNLKLTHDVLASIENRLYQRRVDAIATLKDKYPQEVYVAKLDEALQQLEDGAFDVMRSEAVQKYLQTDQGCVFLLAIMGNITEKELLPLYIDHEAEFQHAMKAAMEISFPKLSRPAKSNPRKRK